MHSGLSLISSTLLDAVGELNRYKLGTRFYQYWLTAVEVGEIVRMRSNEESSIFQSDRKQSSVIKEVGEEIRGTGRGSNGRNQENRMNHGS